MGGSRVGVLPAAHDLVDLLHVADAFAINVNPLADQLLGVLGNGNVRHPPSNVVWTRGAR